MRTASLALLVVAVLVGCGGGNGGSPPADPGGPGGDAGSDGRTLTGAWDAETVDDRDSQWFVTLSLVEDDEAITGGGSAVLVRRSAQPPLDVIDWIVTVVSGSRSVGSVELSWRARAPLTGGSQVDTFVGEFISDDVVDGLWNPDFRGGRPMRMVRTGLP